MEYSCISIAEAQSKIKFHPANAHFSVETINDMYENESKLDWMLVDGYACLLLSIWLIVIIVRKNVKKNLKNELCT